MPRGISLSILSSQGITCKALFGGNCGTPTKQEQLENFESSVNLTCFCFSPLGKLNESVSCSELPWVVLEFPTTQESAMLCWGRRTPLPYCQLQVLQGLAGLGFTINHLYMTYIYIYDYICIDTIDCTRDFYCLLSMTYIDVTRCFYYMSIERPDPSCDPSLFVTFPDADAVGHVQSPIAVSPTSLFGFG